jgi:hypothetical protein
METKVEGISIIIKDQKISLEIEEAKKLFFALKGIFEPETQMHHGWLTYYPVPMPVYPGYPLVTYTATNGTITCETVPNSSTNQTNISMNPLDGTKITNVTITCSPEVSGDLQLR